MTGGELGARRTATGGIALAVCLAAGAASLVGTSLGSLALAGAAHADSGFTFNAAIAGRTRYDTAIAAAEKAFPGGSSSVVLVNARSTVDGLTASYIAGLHNAPILFTDATSTPASTSAEMRHLGVSAVYVVGGPSVVSQGQIDGWKASGLTVTSYGGADRYATAAKAADAGEAGTTVFVASGDDAHLADALAVGPVAYHSHYPILLSRYDDATDPTIREVSKLGATPVLVGGNDVVDDAVMDSLGSKARLSGTNRSLTAAAVADWSIANAGFRKTGVALVGAANANAPDALVAAPVAGASLIPVLFAGTPDTNQYLRNHTADLTGKGEVFGDTTAVSASAVAAATAAATSRQQQLTVSGGGAYVTAGAASTGSGSGSSSSPSTTSAASGNVTYTVAGTPGARLTIALFASAKVTTDSSRNVLLARANRNAAPGTVTAAIASINGTSVGAATSATTVTAPGTAADTTTAPVTSAPVTIPASGTATFVVHHSALAGAGFDTVVPVVYQDVNGDASLNVGTETATTGRPTEPFGVGRVTTFVAAEAGAGAIASSAVDFVDKGAGFFTTVAGKLYTFSSADSYAFTANPVGITAPTYADFVARLSVGDLVTGTAYAPLNGSSFTLNDTDRATPVVTATAVAGTSTVHLSFPRVAGAASYTIYRRTGTDAAFATADYAKVATVPNVASGSVTYDDPVGMLAGTNVHYVVTSTAGGLEGPPASSSVGTALSGLALASGSPTSSATSFTEGGTPLVIDAGDSFTITYSSALAAPIPGATLRLTDADNTVADLVNGTNATFTVSGAVLTVTVTGAPLIATPGTTPTLATHATVAAFANASGITAVGGAPWDVAASATANVQNVTIG